MKKYRFIAAVLLVVMTSYILANNPLGCFPKYRALIRSECNAYSHPKIYVDEFYITINRMYNVSANEEAYATFFAEFCSAKLEVINCFNEKVQPELMDCASDSKISRFTFELITYYSAILNYLCANDAHFMTEMVKGDGVTCLNDLNSMECPSSLVDLSVARKHGFSCYNCDLAINCRPLYNECQNNNAINIWIDLHIAAKTALDC